MHKNTDTKAGPSKRKKQLSPIKNWLYLHSIMALALVFVVLLSLPFFIIALIKLTDSLFPHLQFTRLEDGINIWLSFWGSYLGCIATVILSVGAILLNEKINRYTRYKNMADQIGEFNNFEVRSVVLHNLSNSYPGQDLALFFEPDETQFLLDEAQFLLIVTFKNPFPPHYEVDINEIRLSRDHDALDTGSPIAQKAIVVTSDCQSTKLRLLSNDAELKSFYFLYLTGNNKRHKELQLWLRLQAQCKNGLYANKSDYYQPLQITLDLCLYNKGLNEDYAANLEIEARKIFCEAAEV